MRVASGFGFVVAVIDGIVLFVLDVPGAFVWAVLAFVTNFIPNVGFVIGVVPPAFIALLDSGPGLMLAVIVLYSVINVVIQSMIQPRMVGDAVGLSATLTFLSLVFWASILGPVGAVLAVPLSLFARSILVEADEHHRTGHCRSSLARLTRHGRRRTMLGTRLRTDIGADIVLSSLPLTRFGRGGAQRYRRDSRRPHPTEGRHVGRLATATDQPLPHLPGCSARAAGSTARAAAGPHGPVGRPGARVRRLCLPRGDRDRAGARVRPAAAGRQPGPGIRSMGLPVPRSGHGAVPRDLHADETA